MNQTWTDEKLYKKYGLTKEELPSSSPWFAPWMAAMSKDFFPPRPASCPTIYAYEDTNPQYAGLRKSAIQPSMRRVALPAVSNVASRQAPYRIVLEEPAMRNDGTVFTDRDVHRMLRSTA